MRAAGRTAGASWPVVAWLSIAFALASAASGPAPFVAGDLIVKFTDAREVGAVAARVLGGEAAAERQLPPLAERLSKDLGVPLRALRVTSGRELVFSLDREALLASLTRRVRQDPDVKRTQPRTEPKTVLPPAEIAVVVQCVPDSDAGQLLLRTARYGTRGDHEVEALVARLAEGVVPQPSGRVNERAELILTLDIAALTVQLVERFKQRADVEYAQVSQIAQPFGK